MRDILTALAGAVILILVAALAVPPFIDWQGLRTTVDRAIGRSLNLQARSEGRIEVRLLPSPRLRLDRLHLGDEPGKPALDARFVKAEIALTPLLKGEVRFTETRIGRAEVRLPVAEGDAILLPPDLSASLRGRDLAIEDLRIQQFLLTTLVPATGRTDQVGAENLRVQAPSLAGPWRVEGASRGVPFRFASGEPTPEGAVTVKLSGGGDTQPRFEADARITLAPLDPAAGTRPGQPRAMVPESEGSARLVVGPPTQAAGPYLPFSLGGKFKARGAVARFEGVNAEIDPGGQAMRLAGSGQIDLRAWRAGLSLEARRIDLDAFLISTAGQALIARGPPRGATGLPVMLDLDLAVESLALGLEDWSGLKLTGTLDRTGGFLLRRLQALAPGAAALTGSGEIDTEPGPRFTGRVSLKAAASDGAGRYLRKLGFEGPFVGILDGRPVEASADLSAAAPDFSLRNLRLQLGEASVTGNARYATGEAGGRGRFDAQIAARGIDIAALPSFSNALASLHGRDLGLTIKARDVRYGPSGANSGNGTIAASIQSDGSSLVVDSLDVTDLAGANAKLSGRINPDGAGRITGRLTAPVAAPLLALLDRVWVAEARLIPAFLRAGALDLGVTVERGAGEAEALRIAATGTAAGGSLDVSLLSRAGHVDRLDLTIAAPRAGTWFGRDDVAGLRQAATLTLSGKRAASGSGLDVSVGGVIAGVTVSTRWPIALAPEAGPPASGELRAEGADLGPFLPLLGAAALPGPWPGDLTLSLSRAGGDARADLSGTIAGGRLSAQLVRAPDGAVTGTGTLDRLSLPQLAAALVLPAAPRGADAAQTGPWSSARFAAPPTGRPRLDLDLRVGTFELGRGLTATATAFTLGLDEGGLALRELTGKLAEGRLAGSATLSRQGAAAGLSGEGTLTDASIPLLADGGPIQGRLSAALRFGSTGDSPAALIGNLAGSGDVRLAGLTLPGTDPAALSRALARVLTEDDPLREGRLAAIVGEALSAAPAKAAGPAAAPTTIVGGTLRASPLELDLGAARWSGTLGYDFRTGRLDARGILTGGNVPKDWSGGTPSVQLGLTGPLAAPARSLDAGPLTSGLAALVLQRELEKIELLEADQVERQRRRARVEMDKARAAAIRAAAEKAAADKAAADKAAEDAARQARQRAQQAAAEESARQTRAREAEEAARRARSDAEPPVPPENRPIEVRPPAAQP
ncbi:AsmA family protein [Methylobacterium planeticum]|uniref:AsmA family protein n=1 Tax=Methylobacterium planeticum TaxID=2615211 RepID=A0A6N6MPD0_9HYPH|nr:AsmA family protein [Methylobacterium planeticum]KAB1072807.1 AsmA family protein [Methylobacterium planeticum]